MNVMFRTAQLLIALGLGAIAGPATAQSNPTDSSVMVTASTLLNSGFNIVATNYLSDSIIITLQRSNRAFFCELGHNGISIQCIEVK